MIRFVFNVLMILFVLASCSNPQSEILVKFTGETQGTYYAVSYYEIDGKNFQPQIDSLLHEYDLSVSMWVTESLISRINRNEPNIVLDEHFLANYYLSKEVYEKTDAAFDPTVAPIVNAWGFGFTDRKRVNKRIIDSLLPFVGYKNVNVVGQTIEKLYPQIQIDFNAVAQGYSVDFICKFLEAKGVTSLLVDIGGEILAKGCKSDGLQWKVGIERPKDNAAYGDGLHAIVMLEDKALATSGNYRKFYEENGVRYSHTIDPKTGYPVQHSLLSVSVLADDCGTADAFATAFMVQGVKKSQETLKRNPNIEAYFIFTDDKGEMQTYYTPGFKKILVDEED